MFNMAIESYGHIDKASFVNFEKKSKMTILEPKKEKKIFLKIYFFSKMLTFQDFSK